MAAGLSDERSAPLGDGSDFAERLAELTAAIRGLIAASDDQSAARERLIDRLQAENERLRAGERHLAARPYLVDLRRLRDDLLRQAAALPARLTGPQMAALLESFAHGVEQTLSRGGVEVLRPEVGGPFDGGRQRCAGTVPATKDELDGTIAEVVSDGYLDTATDRALTNATVLVYRVAPPPVRGTGP